MAVQSKRVNTLESIWSVLRVMHAMEITCRHLEILGWDMGEELKPHCFGPEVPLRNRPDVDVSCHSITMTALRQAISRLLEEDVSHWNYPTAPPQGLWDFPECSWLRIRLFLMFPPGPNWLLAQVQIEK